MEIKSNEYLEFVVNIKKQIKSSQYEAFKAVNKEMLNLYWNIGKEIVLKQEEFSWGKSVVKNLAEELQKEFSGISGFSTQNLWRMRNFYTQYKDNQKLAPLVGEISWSKNIIIMEKCKEESQREFYIKMTKKYGWTKNVLVHQIENSSYDKYLSNQTNFDKTLPEKYKSQAVLAVKDDYSFDFLNLADKHAESELEKSIVDNIRRFLIEIGGDFAFIGNQYRIEVEDNEYFIDLLLYNRRLKSLVAIELKIGEFKPEYAGKMQFYLSILDDKVKLEEENPSIGIIICRSKKRTIVEYALKDASKPIGVSTYTITDTLPETIAKYLPSSDELIEKLNSSDIFSESLEDIDD